jgi:hypothetical protein
MTREEMYMEPVIYDRLPQSVAYDRPIMYLSAREIKEGVNCTAAFGYVINKDIYKPSNPKFY